MNSSNWDKQRNDQPQGENPDELVDNVHAQQKIDIKESELGREQSQDPAVEHLEDTISQIDKGTIAMHEKDPEKTSKKPISEADNQTADAEGADTAGYNTINETDDRDQGNSTKDWNAENNDSGRRK